MKIYIMWSWKILIHTDLLYKDGNGREKKGKAVGMYTGEK